MNPNKFEVPVAMDLKHVRYGTWASDDPMMGGPTELGVAFVHAYTQGMGETKEMPLRGGAMYKGSYVATKSTMTDSGMMYESMMNGATLNAYFGTENEEMNNTVSLTLEGLTTQNQPLMGEIDGSRFKGGGDSGMYSGSFTGAFFGPVAVEAGGVFELGMKDPMEMGGVVGSFGAAR